MADLDQLLQLAQDLTASGDHAGAAAAWRRARETARAKGDLKLVAAILTREFQEYWEAADVAGAQRALEEEADVSRQVGNTHQLAEVLMGLAFFPGLTAREEKKRLLDESKDLAARYGYTDIQQQIERRLEMFRITGYEFP